MITSPAALRISTARLSLDPAHRSDRFESSQLSTAIRLAKAAAIACLKRATGMTIGTRVKMVAVACLVLLAWSAGTIAAVPHPSLCGSERRTVATLQDRPKLLPVKNATLTQLAVLPRLRRLPHTRLSDEHRVYRITAQVTLVRQETGGDLRIAISDGSGRKMIVDAPSPACTTGATAARRKQMAKARTAVKVCSDAVLIGVLFHAVVHHQLGEAPNRVELNPLLSFTCLAPDTTLGH